MSKTTASRLTTKAESTLYSVASDQCLKIQCFFLKVPFAQPQGPSSPQDAFRQIDHTSLNYTLTNTPRQCLQYQFESIAE